MSSLGSKAKSSVLWNTGFNLFRDVLQFLVMIILVRMIVPSSYGEFALVTSIIGFIHVFSFNTFIQHVLQVRDDSKVNYQYHFTFGFFLQIFMFIFTNLIAFLMEFFHFYDTVAVYLHVLSIVFFLELFSEIRRMELQRELDWKRMRILHGIGLLIGSALAIGLAYAGAGIYALIIPGFMSNVPFIYEMLIIQKWRPTWEWKLSEYKKTINFSKKRIISGLMTTGKPLIENSLFVAILGYAQLGFYNRAIGLATLLVNKFALQLTFSIYPILTKVEPYTDQFRRIGGLIILFVVWIIVPIAYVVFTMSSELVLILYGDKWLEVIPYLAPAAIIMALNAINHVLYSLLLSSHQEKLCTYYDSSMLIGTVLLLLLVLPNGVLGYLHAQVLLLFGATLFLISVSIYLKVLEVKSVYFAIFPPLLALAFSGIFLENVVSLEMEALDSKIIRLILYSLLFSILYLGVLRVFFSKSLYTIVSYLPGKTVLFKILMLTNNKDQ
jgi:O-antigen/teichoic acid export membrane protein